MKQRWLEYGGYALHIATFITYFVLLATRAVPEGWRWLQWPGMVFFLLGAVLLAASVIQQGKNKAAELMTDGVYGVVRHPLYLGAMLLFCAMFCFMPTWLMSMLSFINVGVIERFVEKEEEGNWAKFGEDYERYAEAVPRYNLIVGLVRRIKEKNKKS